MIRESKAVTKAELLKELLNNDVLHCVTKKLSDSVAKFGINADFSASVVESKRGSHVNFESTRFNTTPAIFRNVWIEGVGYVFEVNGAYNLNVRLDYRMDYFDGGSNGVSLCNVTFFITSDMGLSSAANVSFNVQ